MDSIMQLVLNRSEERLGHVAARVVIDGSRIYICNLLVKIALAAANIPNALQEFSKIAVAALLEPLIVHCKAFLDIFVEPLCRPATEARGNLGLNTITQRDHHIEVIVVDVAFHLP